MDGAGVLGSVYTNYSVVAKKIHILIVLGDENLRMRYYFGSLFSNYRQFRITTFPFFVLTMESVLFRVWNRFYCFCLPFIAVILFCGF